MGLFDKKKEEKGGNIPKALGINEARTEEILEGVHEDFRENDGNIPKVMENIKAEKLTKNELIFACFALGGVKVGYDLMFEDKSSQLGEAMSELKKFMDSK